MKFKLTLVCAALALLVLGATPSWAIKVGLLGADSYNGIVSGYLTGTGQFAAGDITYINISGVTPTPDTLKTFDSVLVWSDDQLLDSATLGNNLADYVDWGGGVVLATFAFYSGVDVGGRIASDGYLPFTVDNFYSTRTLGTVADPTHPIMNGVTSLGGIFVDNVSTNPGATVLARWDDGTPAVAIGSVPSVVGISLYPGEYTMDGLTGDYATLFANALTYTANPAPVPEPSGLLTAAMGIAGIACGFRFRKRK